MLTEERWRTHSGLKQNLMAKTNQQHLRVWLCFVTAPHLISFLVSIQVSVSAQTGSLLQQVEAGRIRYASLL